MIKFKAIDAFCGSGGLSYGLSQAGFEVLFGFDSDIKCIQTIKRNQKYLDHKVVCEDIKNMSNGRLLKITNLKPGELDLLAGGPPCQGFSIQRTVGTDNDERNLLIDDYAQLISEVVPKFFLMENVVGIGGKRGRAILDIFKEKMTQAGFLLYEHTLDAQDYGVPQRRKRVFVVGQHKCVSSNLFKWPYPTVRKRTVRETIGHLPVAAKKKIDQVLPGHVSDRLSELNLKRIRAVRQGEGRTALPSYLLADCHRRDASKIGHRNVYGRMSWDNVAPTITAKFDSFTRGQFGHPEADRSITLHEGALLQTFPNDFQFEGNKVEVAKQIGNAVPPKLALHIGKAIARILNRESN